MNNTENRKMKNMSLAEFADAIASDAPVPGGGSMAALSGAMGGSLTEMVANLTIGKKKYAGIEDEMKEIALKAAIIRARLLEDIQRDSDSYDKVMAVYKMPKNSENEIYIREKAIQESLKAAAEIPLEIAETALELMPLAEAVVEKGNPNAVTDGLVGCMMVRTAVLSALFNVKINLASIKDSVYVNKTRCRVNDIEAKTIDYERKILAKSPF